jgi:hypothetical protein
MRIPRRIRNAVAWLLGRRRALLEEFLLLSPLPGTLTLTLVRLVLMGRLGGRRSCLGRSLRLWLRLSLLPLRRVLLAALVLAAAAAAPMPLRLHLAIGRGRPQIGLGLRRFCRHSCTSWRSAVWCIALLEPSLACSALLSFLCRPPVRMRTGNASAGELVFKEQSGKIDAVHFLHNLSRIQKNGPTSHRPPPWNPQKFPSVQ